MILKKVYYIKSIVAIIIVAMLFSCKDRFNEVQKMGISENEPIGVAEHINLKYTDSGKVTANLLSPKRLDYSNRDFPYNEFTGGVTLYLFDEDNKKSTVISDYAIIYDNTNLIDLQGNVRIATKTNDTLFAEQLYYDQKKEWLYSNKPITMKLLDGSIMKGNIFDTDRNFKNLSLIEFQDSEIAIDE